MILVEKHIIKKSDYRFEELQSICKLSKNLYNVALYNTRQYFFENNVFLSAFQLDSILRKKENGSVVASQFNQKIEDDQKPLLLKGIR